MVAQFALLASALFATLPTAMANLNASCAPGGNFDLSVWQLQLPTGSSSNPDNSATISSDQLEGCGGYEDFSTFFTESGDGAMVMKVCGSPDSCGCVTTSTNTPHCRTELKENNSWEPTADTNRLAVTLAVETPDDSFYGTVVGQVHVDESVSVKPVCELYYNSSGALTMGVEQIPDQSSENFTYITTVPVQQQFSYEIIYEQGELSVSINGAEPVTLGTGSLDNPLSYFKAGNYNQGSAASDVHFYNITITH